MHNIASTLQPEQIHLSITRSSSEMVIMWCTKQPTSVPQCQYSFVASLNPQDNDSEQDNSLYIASAVSKVVEGQQTIYTATLINLQPNALYAYKVGDWDSNVFSKEYRFATRHYGPFPFTMVMFSDFKILDEENKQHQLMKRLEDNMSLFDIILEFGDICYADGSKEIWDKFFNRIQPIATSKPWMVAVGKHEDEGEHGFSAFENRFKMPGVNNFWYSFNYGYAHFLVISTEHDLSPGSPQYQFIVSDLEKANKLRSEVPWIIITGHRALYGSNKRYKPRAKLQREVLVPLIDTYSIDIALFGHCHAYERTHPLYNGQIDPRGTVYLLALTGTQLDKDWEVQPQWSAYRTAHHGYGLLHVKSRKKLRYCYHRVSDGKMWDSFTLTKRKNNKKKISYDYENKFLKNWINTSNDNTEHCNSTL